MSDPQKIAWHDDLNASVTDASELARATGLPDEASKRAAAVYGARVARPLVERIRRGDPEDPILRQFWPSAAELDVVPGFDADPLREAGLVDSGGLLRKYNGRLLILTAGGCAVHCRFCFRRHLAVPQTRGASQRHLAVARLKADASLQEVILSGGDPLMLDDDEIDAWTEALRAIPHVKRLRLHTRMPVAVPRRVTDRLLTILAAARQVVYVALHVNHAREIDDSVREALGRLRRSGVVLLSQSVLLRGVNDTKIALRELMETLVDQGVVSYYLHRLDRVAGAAHFAVPDAVALDLLAALRSELPGYAIPRYVCEVPDAPCKMPLA